MLLLPNLFSWNLKFSFSMLFMTILHVYMGRCAADEQRSLLPRTRCNQPTNDDFYCHRNDAFSWHTSICFVTVWLQGLLYRAIIRNYVPSAINTPRLKGPLTSIMQFDTFNWEHGYHCAPLWTAIFIFFCEKQMFSDIYTYGILTTICFLYFQNTGLLVDVSISDHSIVIRFSDYYEGAAPALIMNHTPRAKVTYRQR